MKTLSIISVAFALLAAALWAWSAFVNIPVIYSGYGTLGTELPDGSTKPGIDLFYAAFKKVSQLNALAAACAFVSAATQAATLFLIK